MEDSLDSLNRLIGRDNACVVRTAKPFFPVYIFVVEKKVRFYGGKFLE